MCNESFFFTDKSQLLTSTFVANRAVGKVAAFGNGNGNLSLDTRVLGSVREQNSTEAARVLAQSLHLLAAATGNRSVCILCSTCTRSKLDGLIIWASFSTCASPINPFKAASTYNCNQSQNANEFHWSLHFCFFVPHKFTIHKLEV